MGAREVLGQTVDVVEVAVGLVLVFLLQLRLVEALVVELRAMGGRDGVGARGRSDVGFRLGGELGREVD